MKEFINKYLSKGTVEYTCNEYTLCLDSKSITLDKCSNIKNKEVYVLNFVNSLIDTINREYKTELNSRSKIWYLFMKLQKVRYYLCKKKGVMSSFVYPNTCPYYFVAFRNIEPFDIIEQELITYFSGLVEDLNIIGYKGNSEYEIEFSIHSGIEYKIKTYLNKETNTLNIPSIHMYTKNLEHLCFNTENVLKYEKIVNQGIRVYKELVDKINTDKLLEILYGL